MKILALLKVAEDMLLEASVIGSNARGNPENCPNWHQWELLKTLRYIRIISATQMPIGTKIKQQALGRGLWETLCLQRAGAWQVNMCDTEFLLTDICTLTPLLGSWLQLAVDESSGMELRLPNSLHLFSFSQKAFLTSAVWESSGNPRSERSPINL